MGTKERRNGRAVLGEAAGSAGPGAGCRGMAALRVLELYSGIGGMHQALKGTGQRLPSVLAAAAAPPCAPVPLAPTAAIFSTRPRPPRGSCGGRHLLDGVG